MTRRDARICAFELLFEYDFHSEDGKEAIYEKSLEIRDAKSSGFAKTLFFTTVENLTAIDEEISKYAEKWTVQRMNAVTRALLRMATSEILFSDTPAKVAINEALEVAKIYGDEKAPSFVNGILNRLARGAAKIED